MDMKLIAVGQKQPDWINTGFAEYAGRLRGDLSLSLTEIPVAKRPKKNPDIQRLKIVEGEKMLAAIGSDHHVIALEERGKPWSTEALARQIETWQHDGRPMALLVGGPDGLSPACIERADQMWSLSPLTLPHGLVRVMVAEALYRSWSWLNNHPYHRP